MEVLNGRRRAWFHGVLLTALMATAAAQSLPVGEEDIKAAFLYNFAKYVDWPDSAFPSNAFRLCVIADPGFVKRVEDIIAGESISGRPVTLQVPSTPDTAASCHILFVGRAAPDRTAELLVAVKGAHVLTVGETGDFLTRGGIVTFIRDGDRVRFDVDVGEARQAGLTISSRLLRVARKVSPSVPR
jgi:hypothetical protein